MRSLDCPPTKNDLGGILVISHNKAIYALFAHLNRPGRNAKGKLYRKIRLGENLPRENSPVGKFAAGKIRRGEISPRGKFVTRKIYRGKICRAEFSPPEFQIISSKQNCTKKF